MKEVGSILNMTIRTEAFHKHRIMEVVGVRSNAELCVTRSETTLLPPRIQVMRATPIGSLACLWVALALLLVAVACSHPAVPAPGAISVSEWHTFEGNWSATGTRQTINLGTNHHASIFDLTGSLLLTGNRGLGVGFRAKTIGFTDSLTGVQGRSVWTDENGDKVYSELKGEMVGTANHITGSFLGGTGRFAGVTGEYSFQWEYVIESDDGTLSGRAVDLKGRAKFDAAAVAPAGEHGQ